MSKTNGDQWIASWVKPMAADNFCGDDASFSQEFEDLKAEVDKDSSVHATTGTDWVIVLGMATEFLSSKSKNVWALVYAVYAYYRVKGLTESVAAFAALTDILTTYWDWLYPLPERLQRRLAPLQWLYSRMETSAKATEFLGESPQTIIALKAECQRLQNFLQQKIGDDTPAFTAVFRNNPPAESAPSTHETPPVLQGGDAPRPAAAPPIADVLTELEADGRVPSGVLPQLVRNILEQNRQLAGHLLSINMLDERAYQLHRTALWSTLLHPPQSDHAGKTQLACVPSDKIRTYSMAVEDKRYAEILPHLERSAAKAPFWLEGHYLVTRCLEGLGATAALGVMRSAFSQLLGRFPELLGYKFQCGTPFAPPKILPWLEALSATPFSAQQLHSEVESGSANEASLSEIRLQEAIGLMNEQNFRAGLMHLGDGPSGRNRGSIHHGILQARYCMAAGKRKAASKLLHALYDKLEQWDLLDWEPDLTANLLYLLCSANPKHQGVSEEMVRRLHWLNIETAVNIFPEK
jgi:type VI secretion system protein VasJ